MCGLTAVLSRRRACQGDLAADLMRMHNQLGHRGPDGEGFLVVDDALRASRLERLGANDVVSRLILGFRWLAIQDTAPDARQPMASPDGSLWVIFNGEIYNFVELRAELSAKGHQFRTHGDTEVIVAAWSEWGRECFRRFRGMWAILLVDTRRRVLVGSRDRFGIKPLFYSADAERILFASEIKAILAVQPRRTNARYLYEYLHGYRSHATEETYYEGIRSVPAGTLFEIAFDGQAGDLHFEQWWEPPQRNEYDRGDYEAISRQLTDHLVETIRLHARAAVKVGSFLSGGLDSAVVSGLLNALEPRQHDSYTVAFDRSRYAAFDESQYVDDFVNATGIPNHRISLDADWVRENIREITRVQEEPLIASTLCAQYRAFELARRCGATVILDGQGSDEIFGGYVRHEMVVWRERLLRGHLTDFAREARVLMSTHERSFPSLLYRGIVRPAAGSAVRTLRLPYLRYGWIDEGAFHSVARPDRLKEKECRRELRKWSSHFDREMVRNLQFGTLRPLFLYSDRSGMAHSVEARLPFVDHRLVEFAFSIPPEMKVGFGWRKRILRDVSRPFVPESIVDRKDKMGFITPEPEWLRRELRDDVLDAVRSETLGSAPFLRSRKMEEFVRGYLDGRHHDFRGVWRLYALRHWLEVYRLS